MTNWLSHLFNLRDKTSRSRGTMSDDEEKPFLSHLEDLRTMIVRVVITLLIATICCFVFNKELLGIILGPAERAGIYKETLLPDAIEGEHWTQIRKLNKAALGLRPEQRTLLYNTAFSDEERWGADADVKRLRAVAEVHYTYLAAGELREEDRGTFLEQALVGQPELLAEAKLLGAAETPADLDGKVSEITMQALSPTETFKLSIKLSLYAGIVIAFPLLFYFIAQFVFPGLTDKEKKMLWPSLTIGFGLFLVGVIFAYYFVTVEALKFFHGYSKDMGVEDQWKIGEYVSFATQLILIFGLSFELPVVVMALVKLDLLTHEFMRRTRSYAIVVILVVAAIITPTPDAIVLSALAGPMIILYEICIWLSYFMKRKEDREEAANAAPKVRPSAGALPVSTEGESGSGDGVGKVAPTERAYDSSKGDAYHSHEPAHDDDPYHGDHGATDYDPYHDEHGHSHGQAHDGGHGYYDDYYKDPESTDTETDDDVEKVDSGEPDTDRSPEPSSESQSTPEAEPASKPDSAQDADSKPEAADTESSDPTPKNKPSEGTDEGREKLDEQEKADEKDSGDSDEDTK